MSNYVKSTNFTSKDTLPSGSSLKIIKGSEFDTEFNAIATAVSTKADLASPTFTGTPLAPTASAGTNNTQIATTAYADAAAAAVPNYLDTTRIDVASASTVNLTTSAPNTRHINITGTTTITGFTVAAGKTYFVRFDNSLTITNGASLVTQLGRNIITVAGDTCILRATAANTVEILDYSPVTPDKQIQSITASVGSSALTVTLNPTRLDFRSSTLSSGTINTRYVQTAISLTVPSGATLGTTNGVASKLTVLAIDNAGTTELAIINTSSSTILDESALISTTILDSASDSADVAYSTTARTNVPFRVVGYIASTQATAGTWATSPSNIAGGSDSIFAAVTASTPITASRLDGAQTGTAPIYGVRAWVSFDGTKDTSGTTSTANTNRKIIGSANVTSVLRNATGDYTVTMTTALPATTYCVVFGCQMSTSSSSNSVTLKPSTSQTTTTFTINAFTAGSSADMPVINVMVLG